MIWTSTPLQVAPAAADGVSVTPNSSAWTWSAWVEVVASASADLLIARLSPQAPDDLDAEAEWQIGIGGVGSEVALTTVRQSVDSHVVVTNESFRSVDGLRLPVLLEGVTSGARVAVRLRKTGSSTSVWRAAISYYAQPAIGNMPSSVKPMQNLPSGATGLSFSPSGAWASTAYQVLSASLPADSVLVGFTGRSLSNGADWEIDFAVGGSGAEVVFATMRVVNGNTDHDDPAWYPFAVPLDALPSGSRVTARARAQSVTTVFNVTMAFIEKPL